jgi:hypothetical protein
MQATDMETVEHSVLNLQKLEHSLRERYTSMDQVSHKASEILDNLGTFNPVADYGKSMMEKVIQMFNKFFVQYQSAFYSDIESFQRVLRALTELVPGVWTASSGERRNKLSGAISFRQASPLIGHMDSLNDILQL